MVLPIRRPDIGAPNEKDITQTTVQQRPNQVGSKHPPQTAPEAASTAEAGKAIVYGQLDCGQRLRAFPSADAAPPTNIPPPPEVSQRYEPSRL
jgi:hypothetical protein